MIWYCLWSSLITTSHSIHLRQILNESFDFRMLSELVTPEMRARPQPWLAYLLVTDWQSAWLLARQRCRKYSKIKMSYPILKACSAYHLVQIHYANETLSKNRHTMPSRLDFTCNKKCVCHILGLCALVITLPTFTGLYEITLENLTISDFKDNGSQRF